jgi:hypothetical protein
VSACLIRNDYNVLFSFLMLVILGRFYNENSKFYAKVLIHMLAALVFVDILWLIIIMPYWNSNSASKNIYWESLSGIHSFVLFIAFLELFLKVGIAGLIFNEYRQVYGNDIGYLLKLSYTKNESVVISKINLLI